MYKEFGIDEDLEKISYEMEEKLENIFKKINEDAMYNSQKVLRAFQKNEVSEMHFGTSTGYGEGDVRKRLYRKNIYRGIRSRRQFS